MVVSNLWIYVILISTISITVYGSSLIHKDYHANLLKAEQEFQHELIRRDEILKNSDEPLVYQANTNDDWGVLLDGGPLLMTYVNKILVHISKRDFPLKYSQGYIAKYIKNANSYQSAVTQVSESVYSTLLNAHSIMSRLELNLEQLTRHVKTALKLVASEALMLTNLMLPSALQAIERVIDEAITHPETIVNKISDLTVLLQEFTEISIFMHNYYISSPSVKRSSHKSYNQSDEIPFLQLNESHKLLQENMINKSQQSYMSSDVHIETRPIKQIESSELNTITKRIHVRDFSGIDKLEVLDIILDTTLQLVNIKEQSQRVSRFFSEISKLATHLKQRFVTELVDVIQLTQAGNVLSDSNDRIFFVELLTTASQNIVKEADLLQIMSKTYFDISSDLMIDKMTSKNVLKLLQTKADRESYLNSLSLNAVEASKKVAQLVPTRLQEYANRTKHRQKEFGEILTTLIDDDLSENIG